MKDVKFCLAFVHDPGSFHSRTKKIVVPDDIKGLKIRPAHATMAAWMTLLGATNVQGAAPQVRDILDKGVADAVTFPWGSVVLFGVDKVTKYHMEAPLYVTTFAYTMNKGTYERMSAAQKKVIDDHCTTEWAGKIGGPWADFEHDGIAKIKAEPGQEVYSITAEQLGEWRKSAEPLQKAWADNVKKAGGNPDVAWKELQDSLKQSSASY
jgi:TRAP-type C4-dicarboxylate transport system substrate-binding protein